MVAGKVDQAFCHGWKLRRPCWLRPAAARGAAARTPSHSRRLPADRRVRPPPSPAPEPDRRPQCSDPAPQARHRTAVPDATAREQPRPHDPSGPNSSDTAIEVPGMRSCGGHDEFVGAIPDGCRRSRSRSFTDSLRATATRSTIAGEPSAQSRSTATMRPSRRHRRLGQGDQAQALRFMAARRLLQAIAGRAPRNSPSPVPQGSGPGATTHVRPSAVGAGGAGTAGKIELDGKAVGAARCCGILLLLHPWSSGATGSNLARDTFSQCCRGHCLAGNRY